MNKTVLSLFTPLLFIAALNFQNVQAQSGTDTEKLDQYFTELKNNDRFIGSVMLMKGDEIVFQKAYGKIDDDGAPATPQSIYRIGSITKSYTAAMILQLVERDELSLTTTLESYFPDIPNGDQITIEHLLRHQSGLINFTNQPEYMEYFTEERSREQMLGLFETIGSSFEPGEKTEYSNTGYVLLGYIIEEITGLSYDEALQKMIAGPLGLSSTYFGIGIDSEKNEADSFTFHQGSWIPATRTNMEIPHGAGAIVSTAEEVARFYRGLFTGEVLSDESLEKMNSFEGPVGLGLIRFPFGNKTLVGHDGGIDGYQSNAAYFAEDDMSYAVLANGVNYQFNDVLIGFLSIAFGEEFEIPDLQQRTTVTPGKEQLELYAGMYSAEGFPLDIEMFVEDSNLMARATGQAAFPLTIYSEREMGFEMAGIEIVFEEPEDGRYRGFQFSQAGMQFDFTLEE